MHLSSVDLNLLVVLDALLETQSIKGAAARLSLSPSATSHALARLRAQFGDDLLTRAGKRMVPTAKAVRLHTHVKEVLEGAERLFQAEEIVRPAGMDRTFLIGAPDFFEIVVLPGLSACVRREAPGVNLFVRPLSDNGIAALRSRELDVAFGVYGQRGLPDDIRLEPLLLSRFVCLLRKDHPALPRWSVKTYAALDHILVSPRGHARGIVDDRLAALGLKRRVSVTVGSFSSAPPLVARSDAVVTISEHIAEVYAERYGLVRRPPPLDLPGFTVSAAWHTRLSNDRELAWLLSRCAKDKSGGSQSVADGHT